MTFPFSEADPLVHGGPLPASAEVVVIGGGVIGTMTALHLARRGVSVVLAEKGRIAGEQSSRNWGWVRQQGRDPAELPIMIDANRQWRALSDEADDLGLKRTGILYLAHTPAEMAAYEDWLVHARAHQLDSRLLTRTQALDLLPGAQGRWVGALWTASDLRAEPWRAVPTLARRAVAAGAVLREGLAVRCLDVEAGRVTGVITEAGRISASSVVLAGGAWSSLFLRAHGVSIPQLSVRATVCATEPLAEVFAGGAGDEGIAWRRRVDGGYTLAPGGFHELFVGPDAVRHMRAFWPQLKAEPFGTRFYPAAPRGYPDAWNTPRTWTGDAVSPFERMRVLNPRPNRQKVEWLTHRFAEIYPALGEVRVAKAWAGMIDTMPDIVPIVDRVPGLDGLTLATGMSGHGFGIGPGFGRIVADLATGRTPAEDLSRFRFARFSDGSRPEIGPHV